MSTVSTHVLDTTRGKPATGVRVTLERQEGEAWTTLGDEQTNADGRVARFVPHEVDLEPGNYRLRFRTGAYQDGFYPEVAITFLIDHPAQHYHVPLLLNPYGYSTYRGS
ncbi:MAG TPA: hydroxyisourate hydrolase [Bryobacteraceae bacterium]|jgi:5-hydroxyisourate hydrolase|nr:hydroxyisourate hydrolase [Bryobacteraceae bacterium]